MYYHEDYIVKEAAKSYLVTESFNDEFEKIRIEKSTINQLGIEDEEPEKLAILLATIEAIRNDNCPFDKNRERNIVGTPEFARSLRLALSFETIENLISEVSQMKYHEIKEYFS